MNDKEFITPYGLFCTLVATVVGIGIFSYPRELISVVGTDAWLETIIAGAICLLIIGFIWRVEKINNYTEFNVLAKRNLGKWFGSGVLIIVAGAQIFALSVSMRTFVEVIKMYLLDKTPTEFLIIVTIFLGTYLIRGGLGSIIKFNEVALWTMFIPLIFVLLLTSGLGDYTNILPVLHNPPLNYVKALRSSTFSFGGIEILFLIIPFLKDKKLAPKAIGSSIAFITIFYVIIIVLVLAIFSTEYAKTLIWPTITMIKTINVPGSFFERWEGLIMALWVLFYFTTFCSLYYFSSYILKDAFRLEDEKLSSLIIAPFIYLIAMFPENIGQLFDIVTSVVPFIFIFDLIVVPILLYFTGKAKAERGRCD